MTIQRPSMQRLSRIAHVKEISLEKSRCARQGPAPNLRCRARRFRACLPRDIFRGRFHTYKKQGGETQTGQERIVGESIETQAESFFRVSSFNFSPLKLSTLHGFAAVGATGAACLPAANGLNSVHLITTRTGTSPLSLRCRYSSDRA
jgi:hypothetical protein